MSHFTVSINSRIKNCKLKANNYTIYGLYYDHVNNIILSFSPDIVKFINN